MAFSFCRVFTALLAGILLVSANCGAQNAESAEIVSGVVQDALGRSVPNARIRLNSPSGKSITKTRTDRQGLFLLKEASTGTYVISVWSAAFLPARATVILPRRKATPIKITLESIPALVLPVRAKRIFAQNGLSQSGTNKYTFTAKDITNLPQGEATTLNQMMLQMPGVALDQNQEIHVRGEHMGIQYQLNGILLPLDMNTDPTFTQLLNSYFVQSVSLMDGVLPARYGYRSSGVIDIRTKNGCDLGKNSATIMGGQRDTAQGNFQIGGCDGNLGYYLTGTFLQSNLGFSSAVPAPGPIHDAVTQGQGFAYLTYALGPTTKLSLISGMTLAFNQFPNQPNLPPQYQLDHLNPASYPSSAIDSGLNQQDYYGVLALNGALNSNWEYQVAYSTHYNTQTFYPDPIGDLIYQGVSSNVFTSDLSNTVEGDLTYRFRRHSLRGGFYLGEYGVESDQGSQVFPIVGGQPTTTPIALEANLNRINLVYGCYFEDALRITDQLSVNFGTRWDRVTGFTKDSQFSPTINFVYKPRTRTTVHAGFARNFQVPNLPGNLQAVPRDNRSGWHQPERQHVSICGDRLHLGRRFNPSILAPAGVHAGQLFSNRPPLPRRRAVRIRANRRALQLRSGIRRRHGKLRNLQSRKSGCSREPVHRKGGRYRRRVRPVQLSAGRACIH